MLIQSKHGITLEQPTELPLFEDAVPLDVFEKLYREFEHLQCEIYNAFENKDGYFYGGLLLHSYNYSFEAHLKNGQVIIDTITLEEEECQ